MEQKAPKGFAWDAFYFDFDFHMETIKLEACCLFIYFYNFLSYFGGFFFFWSYDDGCARSLMAREDLIWVIFKK